MDVTPLVKKGQQIIQSYAGGSFKISGIVYQSPVIVRPEGTQVWTPSYFHLQELTPEDFRALADLKGTADVVLLGTGAGQVFLSPLQKQALGNLKPETMDTGAACRTYNVLMAEGRRVAAALLPVPAG